MSNYLMPTYKPLPVTFTHGEGAWLWDNNGRKYLDALSGIAVSGIGHAHPVLSAALADQASRLIHVSNLYQIQEQKALGEKLCQLSDMDNVFFCNSGAEANEAAIKLARLYGHQQQHDKPRIIVLEGSFHGRTMATLSATGNPKVRAGFEPLVEGFIRLPYNDIEAIQSAADQYPDIVAILLEPVQGEGGIRIPDDNYLPRIREICDQRGWLMMLDEIQSGMGRTGKWFAHEHYQLKPDVMTLAKGLGNGVPIGACLASGVAAKVFAPGNHGSTFGGNPLASRAANTVLKIIADQELLENADQMGRYLLQGFQDQLANIPGVSSIRGSGLMLGIELDRPCADLVTAALDEGMLINVTADSVIRLLPPLIIDQEQADLIIQNVSTLIRKFLESN